MSFEHQRSFCEELERIEVALSQRIARNPALLPSHIPLTVNSPLAGRVAKKRKSDRETIFGQHEVAKLLDRYRSICGDMLDISADDKLKEKELAALDGTKAPTLDAIFATYDAKVDDLRAYHRKYAIESVNSLADAYELKYPGVPTTVEDDLDETTPVFQPASNLPVSSFAADLNIDALFSGQENYGNFMDVYHLHDAYLNLASSTQRLTYTQYLTSLLEFPDDIVQGDTTARLNDPGYLHYLIELDQYIIGFLQRTRPIDKIEAILSAIEAEFQSLWANGSTKWNQLNDKLVGEKEQQKQQGFYCEYCDKVFAKESVYLAHLTGRKHIKAVEKAGSLAKKATNKVSTDSTELTLQLKNIAYLEHRISQLCQQLSSKILATKTNVERRATLTERERTLEQESSQLPALYIRDSDSSSDSNSEDEENEDDSFFSNPRKFPVGWDGNPIPYWLWKYNGLGHEFTCEICGGFAYKGRKAFEKHFLEIRHIHGLKCLGVEPSGLFKDITNIQEAKDLWAKIQRRKRMTEGQHENAVEVEDAEGNVMSEKVYNDLVKQGYL
ncbi:hypothetical protein NADFUDRAFT_67758 [Nadsonia fulvescens var. elongata DSM 6958]|uniref:C2H2-type domain-containing protein n=1 Tax=Nadsonia fulvescens var. elongata DSM 6958 TaxID=857566 RepID=A0A1E3PEN1_9ASCO|nr:hypothetical protein NADFUDRAFT_67758 [Nadsonia fulvescens var. elongata DSM 6958]